jgi:hypothetical protein
MKIVFDSSFPTQLRQEFDDILLEYKAFIPPWLKRLTIHFGMSDDQNKNAALEMLAQEEYRAADMVVYPPYLSIVDAEYKKLCVLHELCHNFYDRLRNAAYNAVALLPEEVQKLAAEQVRTADESVTQDLAEAFTELLNDKNKKNSKEVCKKVKKKPAIKTASERQRAFKHSSEDKQQRAGLGNKKLISNTEK